jgi:hypothetical protein
MFMQRFQRIVTVAALLLACCLEGSAQPRPILSPRDSVSLSLDTNRIDVNYGRPSTRGRTIMGQLVPWNQVWRTGANQATHLRTNFDMTLGGVPVPRGRYTLWTLPSPTGWKLILNKQTNQWGTSYDAAQDLARCDAKVEHSAANVDTFTIALRVTGKTSGVLSLAWEHTLVSVPFEKNDRIRPLSPPDSAETTLAGKKITVKYSRPYARGRAIWGVVVPNDSIWRAGANAATSLLSETDLTIGGVAVPKGSYTLYAIASPSGLTLIISKKPGGGAPAYDPKLDLARVGMRGDRSPATIDPFRIWFETRDGKTAELKLGWAEKVFAVSVAAP